MQTGLQEKAINIEENALNAGVARRPSASTSFTAKP
jgi:hypothetical protein